MPEISIARVATVPEAFGAIRPLFKFLSLKKIKLSLICSDGEHFLKLKNELQFADIVNIEIKREISILKDIKSLFNLYIYFKNNYFHIIHSSTPKAGLLVAISGFFFKKSIKVHTFTGQRWATMKGFKRFLMKYIDRLIIKLNDQCYADSQSQIDYLISEKIAAKGEVICLGRGSYGGIDIGRFSRKRFAGERELFIKQNKLSDDSILLLFVGRVTGDKGINELVESFTEANKIINILKLVLVGPFEEQLDPVSASTMLQIKQNPDIIYCGFQSEPEKFFSLADIFCLPSYREGFGNVVIEAASCELPSIVTNISGLKDTVIDNKTGSLVPVKDVEALTKAILDLATQPKKRLDMGREAQIRAHKFFKSVYLSELMFEEYKRLLNKKLKIQI